MAIRKARYVRKKKTGNIKWLLKILILFLIFFTAYYFIHSDFFALSNIVVSGTKTIEKDEIIALSGLSIGENIFKADVDEGKQKVALHALVAGSEIKKKLPRTIEIIVEEREPAAMVQTPTGLLQVDLAGFVIGQENRFRGDLPIITGSGLKDTPQAGTKINGVGLVMALKMVAQMDLEAKKKIAEVNVSDPQKIKIYTVEGAEVRFGNSDEFSEKYDRFIQVIEEEERLGKVDNIEYIDVSFIGRPVVYYRK